MQAYNGCLRRVDLNNSYFTLLLLLRLARSEETAYNIDKEKKEMGNSVCCSASNQAIETKKKCQGN